MNKMVMWLIVILTVVFLGLLVFGVYAEKRVEQGIENIQKKKEKTDVKTEKGEDPLFYGNHDGEKLLLDEGVAMWVGEINHGRYAGTAVIKISVVNKRDEEYVLNMRNLYLEDSDGDQYPSHRYQVEGADMEEVINKNEVYEAQEAFILNESYSGEFDGWRMVYEGEDDIYRVELKKQ